MKKNHVLVIVVILIIAAIAYLESASPKIQEVEVKAAPREYKVLEEVLAEKSQAYKAAPELAGISGHINTDGNISIGGLKGKVVLVDFWTYTCINCIRTLPYLKMWDEKYRNEGLVIIGVHTPEFEFEKEYGNVLNAVEEHGIQYPVVQDNDYATWRAFQNRFWPRKYLIDIDGFIVYDHIGEGAYKETEEKIQDLLKERMEKEGVAKELPESAGELPEAVKVTGRVGTPEIYLGSGFYRGNFGNKEGLAVSGPVEYTLPEELQHNTAYFEGTWVTETDASRLVSETGKIVLPYDAKVVNIVAGAMNESEIAVFVDGRPEDKESKGADIELVNGKPIGRIQDHRLYSLVEYQYGQHVVEIEVKGKGFMIYTFTFG